MSDFYRIGTILQRDTDHIKHGKLHGTIDFGRLYCIWLIDLISKKIDTDPAVAI
jgi:hypothetical protein